MGCGHVSVHAHIYTYVCVNPLDNYGKSTNFSGSAASYSEGLSGTHQRRYERLKS